MRPKLTENKIGHTNKTRRQFCSVQQIQMLRSCTMGGEQMTAGWLKMPKKQKRHQLWFKFARQIFRESFPSRPLFCNRLQQGETEANQACFASAANFVNWGKWSVHHHDSRLRGLRPYVMYDPSCTIWYLYLYSYQPFKSYHLARRMHTSRTYRYEMYVKLDFYTVLVCDTTR